VASSTMFRFEHASAKAACSSHDHFHVLSETKGRTYAAD
jgi:hypothetical protein